MSNWLKQGYVLMLYVHTFNNNDNDDSGIEIDEDGIDTNILNYTGDMNDENNLKYTSNEDMAPYNLMSGKLLAYSDVFKITTNIARTQLNVVLTKDENMLLMEDREKNKLRQELNKYMKNINIQKNFTAINIDELNLNIEKKINFTFVLGRF